MTESVEGTIAPVVVRCCSRTARCTLGAATALLVVASVTVLWIFAESGWNVPMAAIAVFLTGMTLFAGCVTIASIWNTVSVGVVAGDVVIEAGPVPWTRRRIITGASIEQLYVQHAPLGTAFRVTFGGLFDVQGRMRDGRWIRLVKGCRSEDEARLVERLVERALKRPNECGRVEDDDRSEIFSNWRESIGPSPRWLKVQRRGDVVKIRYRDTFDGIFLGLRRGAVAAALAAYVLSTLSTWVSFGGLVWSGVLAAGVTQALWAIVRRGSIIIDAQTLTRKGDTFNRRDIGAIDCRSRTRLKRTSMWGTYRRVRRYFVEAQIARRGAVGLAGDLRHRGQGLHIMRAILEALGRERTVSPRGEAGKRRDSRERLDEAAGEEGTLVDEQNGS